jgi:hypothetical protein
MIATVEILAMRPAPAGFFGTEVFYSVAVPSHADCNYWDELFNYLIWLPPPTPSPLAFLHLLKRITEETDGIKALVK